MQRLNTFCRFVFLLLLTFGIWPALNQGGIWRTAAAAPLQAPSDCTVQTDIPATECQALVTLYNSMNGPGWRLNNGWLQNNYPCTWAAVICVNNHVDVLNLGSNHLQGTIPAAIGDFPYLRQLQLRDNQLTGAIPARIGDLSNLQRLWLDHTQLSGQLPVEIGNLSNLQWLYADHAQLSGPLHPELANLTNLQVLTLSANQFSGAIPAAIGSMTGLHRLELAANQLGGDIPHELANLTNLEGSTNSLDLTYNKLSTTDPALLAYLNTYQWLWYRSQTVAPTNVQATASAADTIAVSWTPIVYTGDGGYYEISYATNAAGPYTVAGVTVNKSSNSFTLTGLAGNTTYSIKLRTFTPAHGDQQNALWSDDSAMATATTPAGAFSCNGVTEIPATECQALVTFFTDTNGANWSTHTDWVTTNTPCRWFGLTCYQGHVYTIDLRGNGVSGTLAAALADLTNLDTLILNGNQISGSIPPELGNLRNLRILWLDTNQVTGSIPTTLGKLTKLETIDLGINQLSGGIPSELGNLVNLNQLQLQGNPLGGAIPATLANLTQLAILNLNGTQVTGDLPAWLGNLLALSVLWLDNNQLTGPIPPELGQLTNLQALDLGLNQLTGPLPSGLSNLTQLTQLALQGNHLSGPLPDLSRLSNLNTLFVAGNQLSGPLPSWLGTLVNLNVLWLHANQFCGAIPANLVNLVNLRALDLSYNCLSATDPALVSFLDAYQANWALTQTIPPSAIQAQASAPDRIDLTWQIIPYIYDGGSYEISYATNPTGPFTVAGNTPDKVTTSFRVTGLAANTTYYLKLRTFTPAHGAQQNALGSEASAVVAATTLPTPAQPIIKIVEDAQPDSGFNFGFTGSLGAFQLDDANPDDGDGYSNSQTFTVNAGAYVIEQTANATWYLADLSCSAGTNAAVDLLNRRVTITVSNGDQVLCTFSNQRYVTISAQLYYDKNGNGQRNGGEPGLAGWSVKLFNNQNGRITTLVTNKGGNADFTQLPAGQYQLCEVLQSGWYNTQPKGATPCYALTLTSGQVADARFGNNVGVGAASAQAEQVDPDQGVTIATAPDAENQAPIMQQVVYLPLVAQ